jgi:putrescine---pyruvate transaminase
MTDDRVNELIHEDIEHYIHPITNLSEHAKSGPSIFVKGKGAIITDIQGRDYIDGLACLWNVTLGHGREELAEAAAAQMKKLAFSGSFGGSSHLPVIELATRMATLTPGDLNHFFFGSGGSDANEGAIKMARYFWKLAGETSKVKIISRKLAYHGVTYGAMTATGIASYHKYFEPMVPGFSHIAAPYCYRCDFGKDCASCGLECAQALEDAILAEGPETVAAFIGEPIQGVGGVIVPPDGYLQKIRQICSKYNVLMIVDEVITGFGRTGKYWGVQNWDVVPDMLTLAKGITSGYQPLGAVAVSDRIYKQLMASPPELTFLHGYTYSGHPTCCAVALATLDIYERENSVAEVARKGKILIEKLKTLEELPIVGEVRGLGLMASLEIVKNKETKEAFPPMYAGKIVGKETAKLGLLSRGAPNGVSFAPAFVITEEQIDQLVERAYKAVQNAAPILLGS